MIICANLNGLGFLLPVKKLTNLLQNCNLDTLMKAGNSLTQFHWELSKRLTSFHSAILIMTDIEVNY